jgi:hypothetical protein
MFFRTSSPTCMCLPHSLWRPLLCVSVCVLCRYRLTGDLYPLLYCNLQVTTVLSLAVTAVLTKVLRLDAEIGLRQASQMCSTFFFFSFLFFSFLSFSQAKLRLDAENWPLRQGSRKKVPQKSSVCCFCTVNVQSNEFSGILGSRP